MVSPFTDHRRHRGAVWLEPRVVAEVTFSEMMNGWLRDPVFLQVGGAQRIRTSALRIRSPLPTATATEPIRHEPEEQALPRAAPRPVETTSARFTQTTYTARAGSGLHIE